MNNESKYSNLFNAIKVLFNGNDINQKEQANSFITEWQISTNSIRDCIEIISFVQEPHIIFIIIKTIQVHIRFHWENIQDNELQIPILSSLLNLLKKPYISQLHQDFILICISDFSNQTGILNETILNSIPPQLILRFFSFFFENWHEPFITHLIQPNFIPLGFEMLAKVQIGNEWLRIMKCLSSEVDEIDCFIPFFQQLIQLNISNENYEFFNEIVSNFCYSNFHDVNKFHLFVDFFTNCSRKTSSLYLWISFFEIRTDFFNLIEKSFLNLFELAMNEFFRVCLSTIESNSADSSFLWIDIISIAFSFFQEYNLIQMIKHQMNFFDLILTLISSLIIDDEDIRSILSNLHILSAFQPFIQNHQRNLPFYLICVYNSKYVPFEFIRQITEDILANVNNNKHYLLLSFIEKTYSLLEKNISNQFLIVINELFQAYPNKSCKVLFSIVSKNYMSIPGNFFDLFHHFIQFASPFVIPSLLYLMKNENYDFYNEIQSKIVEITNHLHIYNSLAFIYSLIKKFPKDELPFLSPFFNTFSIFLFNLLAPISLNSNDAIINNKIVEIFTIFLNKKYLTNFNPFIQWIDQLMTVEGRVSEYHVYFISNFNIFSFHNLKLFLDSKLVYLHSLSFDELNESDLFKSIINLMEVKSLECPIEMWTIFSIQFLFDALSMKSDTIKKYANNIVLNNVRENNSASNFVKLIVSHLFTDADKLSVVLLLSSISRKMDREKYASLLANSFPYNSDILNQFISILMNSINISQLLLISQQVVQFYS